MGESDLKREEEIITTASLRGKVYTLVTMSVRETSVQ